MPDAPTEPTADRSQLIVGIGASAGGVDAFKAFFSQMLPNTGMTFVLVQHLDPVHSSSLAQIIGGYTEMPVVVAVDGKKVERNQVYVIPPDAILTIQDGVLRIARPAPPIARRTSINTFLTSLAADQGENAVGIILSGYGSDGALGIAAIKEHGGLTLSQAEFDHHAKSGMPQSAASGGFVDHVLAVEAMPGALVDYQSHRLLIDGAKGSDGIRADLPGHLGAICAVLHGRLGRDFSQYKTGTLMRRIQRRMQVLRADTVPEYVEQLRASAGEAELLFRELLISVTRFFRDAEVFDVVATRILPAILAADSEPIRVWVPGCATGEEAYSIAILVREALTRLGDARPVQIFATDLDARAIEAARAGLFPASIAADVSAERLERHFVKEDGFYRVAKDLREMCLFTVHDLVKDPPFSRLDLVSCRNLLIYFTPALQQRVLTTFHYSLRPGRFLLLGPSEGVTAGNHLFSALDKRHRIFVRRDGESRMPTLSVATAGSRQGAAREIGVVAASDLDRRASAAVARHAPAYVIVDRRHDVLRFAGQTGRFLEPANGVATLNLFSLLRMEVRTAVRTALAHVERMGSPFVTESVHLTEGDRARALNIIVEPLGVEGSYVVVFQDAGSHSRAELTVGQTTGLETAGETTALREQLRNVTEELEAANEELQSSNEEYLSVNEELQSSNEELETSKEELQALNEELQTINAELSHRNDSLVRSNSDLANLFESTSIATLFLDKDLRIRRFTPRLLDIFKVREGDEGRPISDIVSHLAKDGLAEDVQKVLLTLAPIEREVDGIVGKTYLMRVQSYRDINNVVDGAVVTFIDISERKQHELARSQLAAIVDTSQDAIISHDLSGKITSWNSGAERLFGYGLDEAVGRQVASLLYGLLPEDWPLNLGSLQNRGPVAPFDGAKVARNGDVVNASVSASPIEDANGKVVGLSLVARDITERKQAEHRTALLLGELDHRVKNILAVVSSVVTQTLKSSATPEAFEAEMQGRIGAIAKAHSLLTEAGLGAISLRAILQTELAPYERHEGRIEIAGPDVALTPRAGLALAMALHELASNAAKYGALSVTSGRLKFDCHEQPGPDGQSVILIWRETGGPPLKTPTRRGFGSTLIERTLAHELDAEVDREFRKEGLVCTILIPLNKETGVIRANCDLSGATL